MKISIVTPTYNEIENIEKLYVDSLNVISVDPVIHPLRIIEASKSIIGIKPETPLEKLLLYCEGKTIDVKLVKKKYDFSKSKLPEVVSLLNLENILSKLKENFLTGRDIEMYVISRKQKNVLPLFLSLLLTVANAFPA